MAEVECAPHARRMHAACTPPSSVDPCSGALHRGFRTAVCRLRPHAAARAAMSPLRAGRTRLQHGDTQRRSRNGHDVGVQARPLLSVVLRHHAEAGGRCHGRLRVQHRWVATLARARVVVLGSGHEIAISSDCALDWTRGPPGLLFLVLAIARPRCVQASSPTLDRYTSLT